MPLRDGMAFCILSDSFNKAEFGLLAQAESPSET